MNQFARASPLYFHIMRILLGIALLFFPAILVGQQTEQPIRTTLCEIKTDPMSFNKKLVEVSGYATHGFEDSMFEDPTCFWGRNYPGIWMEYGGTSSTDTMFCCGFSPSNTRPKPLMVQGVSTTLVLDETFERLNKLLHSETRKDISVRSTILGRFFALSESEDGRPKGFRGYGHMGCCMLIVIEQVKSVDSTKPEKSIFDMAHDFERTPTQKPSVSQADKPKP